LLSFLSKKALLLPFKIKNMYYTFRLFIFILILVSCNTSSHRKTDWEDQNLHGQVKSVIVTQYKVYDSIKNDDGTPYMDQERLSVSSFNNKGFLTEFTDSISNKQKSRSVYSYLKDNVVEIVSYRVGRRTSKNTLKYNDKGEVIDEEMLVYVLVNEKDSSYIKERSYKLVNKYDKRGNKIRKEELSSEVEGLVKGFTEFKYDEKGDIIEIVSDYEEYEMKRKFKSNNKRDVLSLKLYDLEDNLMSEYLITNYVYDKNHNWISRKIEVRDKNNNYKETQIEKRIISYYK
jgi:putative YD repeat protein